MIENNEKKGSVSNGTIFQLFAAFIATLLAVTDGMSYGWTAPMMSYFTSEESHIKMTLEEVEWMETWLMIGTIMALPVTVISVEKIGRKKTLLISCTILIASWIMIAVGGVIEIIYAGRFMQGSGINMAFVAAPMYVGEIAHKNFRGMVASTVFVMMMFGVLLDYSSIPFVSYYVPPIIAVCFLSTQLIVFSFLPETPYYLIKIKQYDKAKKSLQSFRGNSNINDEFEEILREAEIYEKENMSALKAIFQVKSYRKALLIVIFLAFVEPFSCQEIILMNLHEILNSAGSVYMDSTYAAIIFASLMMVSALASSIMVDRFGRKLLLIISIILTGLCLLTLGLYFHLKRAGFALDSVSWIPVVAVMVYALVFKVGLGMVPIVIATEILTVKIRALGMTLGDGIYVTASITSLQIFFISKSTFGMHASFYTFAVCVLFMLIITIFWIPETKGKSMEEIQQILNGTKVESIKDEK
ncbi:facilitated trehalose transporter Tret1 isoform X1 [Leptinotarsa decemlineata]|uniref:facilitated trehalose transporter Tret1 isoform X1 n=2 Tax=Leptinotarsa decemlineata TaxID=7539 RepID=UPI003D307C02